jgi:hypothetical protein
MDRPSKSNDASGKQSLIGALIAALPSLLWVILAATTLVAFYNPLSALLLRATKLKVAGTVEIEAQIEQAGMRLPPAFRANITNKQEKALARRWSTLPLRDRPYRVLIAHDVFEEAKPIQAAFLELGFIPDIALCPNNVEQLLRQHVYDVVVSDVDWSKCKIDDSRQVNGIKFLQYAVTSGFSQPTVFFILNYKPELGTPTHAVGITNNWYEVLNYVVDVLSRSAVQEFSQR